MAHNIAPKLAITVATAMVLALPTGAMADNRGGGGGGHSGGSVSSSGGGAGGGGHGGGGGGGGHFSGGGGGGHFSHFNGGGARVGSRRGGGGDSGGGDYYGGGPVPSRGDRQFPAVHTGTNCTSFPEPWFNYEVHVCGKPGTPGFKVTYDKLPGRGLVDAFSPDHLLGTFLAGSPY